MADTDWAACLIADNQEENIPENYICPGGFPRIEDFFHSHYRGCRKIEGKKRVCCLLQPTTSLEVRCPDNCMNCPYF